MLSTTVKEKMTKLSFKFVKGEKASGEYITRVLMNKSSEYKLSESRDVILKKADEYFNLAPITTDTLAQFIWLFLDDNFIHSVDLTEADDESEEMSEEDSNDDSNQASEGTSDKKGSKKGGNSKGSTKKYIYMEVYIF